MAAEFLLTFLAVLVQLGLPARQNQISGKEFESGYAMYRSVTLSYYCSFTHLSLWFVFLFWLSGKFTFTFTGTGNIEAYEWAYLLSEVCLSCLLLLLLSFAKYFVSRVGLVLMSDFTFTFLGKRMRTNEWANLLVLLFSSAQESGFMGGPAYCARLTSPDLFYFHLQVLNRRVQWVD